MSNRVLADSKFRSRHYIVRIVKPKTSSYSHDWHVLPDCQRSVAGDRLSGPLGSRNPQLSCVSSNLLRCFKRIYRDYLSFGSLSTDYFSVWLALTYSTNFERSAQNAHGVLVGVLPRRGFFPRLAMDCSLWKVLPSLPIFLDAQGLGGLGRTFKLVPVQVVDMG